MSLCLLTAVVLTACGGGYTGADASTLGTSQTSSTLLSVSTYGSAYSKGRPADAGGFSTPTTSTAAPSVGPTPIPASYLVATAAPTPVYTAPQTPAPAGNSLTPISTTTTSTPTAAPAPTLVTATPTKALTAAPATTSSSTSSCGVADVGNWTIPVPSTRDASVPLRSLQQPGSRLFYISAATGSDATGDIYFWDGSRIIDSAGKPADASGNAYGTDPMNPSAAVKAFKRWAYVGPRQDGTQDIGSPGTVGGPQPATRAGFPDWWMFKRGETFDLASDLLSFARQTNPSTNLVYSSLAVPGGRSATERQIVGAYGDVCQPRPRFVHPMLGFVSLYNNAASPQFKNVAYLSLQFDGHDVLPVGTYGGITLLYQTAASTDILFEDIWLDAAPVNIGSNNGAQITLRRDLITDAFSTAGFSHGPLGIYYEGASNGVLRIEESILMRNGFSNGDPKTLPWPPTGAQTWDMFSRNLYLNGKTNSMQSGMFDSVSMMGASGDQFRPGMRVERNFFYQGYVSMGAYGGYPDSDGATGTMTDNILQRFLGTGTNSNVGQPGWGMNLTSGAFNVEVARNIVTGAQYAGTGAAFGISPLSWVCYDHTFHYATRYNRVHNNIFESPSDSAPFTISDGVTGESTPGCAQWQPPGVKGNVVSNNVLVSPSGTATAYVPVGAAVGTSNDTAYSGNTFYASRAAAASALGWVNPNRTLKTYMQANGVPVTSIDGFPEYFGVASQLRRGQWQPQWTGKALVNYVRSGFGVPALP